RGGPLAPINIVVNATTAHDRGSDRHHWRDTWCPHQQLRPVTHTLGRETLWVGSRRSGGREADQCGRGSQGATVARTGSTEHCPRLSCSQFSAARRRCSGSTVGRE